MAVSIQKYLKARRDRALGQILGHAEREFYDLLSPAQKSAFRQSVLDAMVSYHDSVLDLVKSDDAEHNEVLVEILTRIDQNTSPQGA